MIATILNAEMARHLDQLNRRKNWELAEITARTPAEIVKAIENGGEYTCVLIEIEAIKGNLELAFDVISRLQKTTTTDIVVIAPNYDRSNNFLKDIEKAGVPDTHILTDNYTMIKKRLSDILPADTGSFISETEEPEPQIAKSVTPPSQIPRSEARQAMVQKLPPKVKSSFTIGVAGASERIGTTTQAMQIMLFLKANGYNAALVELHDRPALEEYIKILDEKDIQIIDNEHFRLRGIDVFKRTSFLKAKKEFDYIVIDYGRFDEIQDVTSFLDKNIRIVVCGIKPWESERLYEVFSYDNNSMNYIFSFVPKSDIEEIKELMEDSKDVTYFA